MKKIFTSVISQKKTRVSGASTRHMARVVYKGILDEAISQFYRSIAGLRQLWALIVPFHIDYDIMMATRSSPLALKTPLELQSTIDQYRVYLAQYHLDLQELKRMYGFLMRLYFVFVEYINITSKEDLDSLSRGFLENQEGDLHKYIHRKAGLKRCSSKDQDLLVQVQLIQCCLERKVFLRSKPYIFPLTWDNIPN